MMQLTLIIPIKYDHWAWLDAEQLLDALLAHSQPGMASSYNQSNLGYHANVNLKQCNCILLSLHEMAGFPQLPIKNIQLTFGFNGIYWSVGVVFVCIVSCNHSCCISDGKAQCW